MSPLRTLEEELTFALSADAVPHVARLLGTYVREQCLLTLEAAVHKSTLQVARRFAIPDRGLVAPGSVADLVVFDPARIADRATYENPHQFAAGVAAVIVGGQMVLRDGQPTGQTPGVVLRRVS